MPDFYELTGTKNKNPLYRIVVQSRYSDDESSAFGRRIVVQYYRFYGKNSLKEAEEFIRDRNLIERFSL
jgi:hypothetical protein